MVWETGSALIPKADAITAIQKMAKDQGLKGTFKVFYEGNIVADPNNLPDQVNMEEVEVSAVLDQAACKKGKGKGKK